MWFQLGTVTTAYTHSSSSPQEGELVLLDLRATQRKGGGIMATSKGKGKGTSSRSAITGRYVTKAHAKRNPRTTVNEKRK